MNSQLEAILTRADRAVVALMRQVPMRTAACTIASGRVAEAGRLRGGF